MMQCSVDAISQWAKGERQPSGPARVLMNRIAEEYGLPTMTWTKSNATKDPE
jgi:DNA-binding transcriptional regulator YiaG